MIGAGSDARAFSMGKLLVALLLANSVLPADVGRGVSEAVRSRGHARVFVLLRDARTFAREVDAAALEQLSNDDVVAKIDIDAPGGGGDAESLPLIGGNIVQALGFRGDGVTVAVLDSGYSTTHPDLASAVIDEACFCRNSDGTGCCPNKSTTQFGSGAAADENGHGTNVTGIIASRGTLAPVGVAPGVKVVAVRVLDAGNRFSGVSQIIEGLQWVADHHPEVRAVNMSLLTDAHFAGDCDHATSYNETFSSLVAQFRSRGTLVFACAGNTGSSTSMGSPACVQPVVSVGAVYDANIGPVSCGDGTSQADKITCFSDSDASLDFFAPGAAITSTGLSARTSTYQGTSMASPHAAGSAAVLMSIRPDLSADAIEAILKATGKPLFDARNGVTKPRIDLLTAVESLVPQPPRHRAARH